MSTKPRTQSFLKSGSAKRPSKLKIAPASLDQQMMPLSLRLTQPQLDGLNVLRQKTGLRQNELVRRAIDEFLRKELA